MASDITGPGAAVDVSATIDPRFERPLSDLLAEASKTRDIGHGQIQTYSRKVFIPLTHLCRDVCHYCTFAHPPKRGEPAYLTPDQVLDIARAGAAAGCQEALFTLGDKPERRYRAAREALADMGYETTIDYLAAMCDLVWRETGLLPHANPGVMDAQEIAALRAVSVSQGIMLESASPRLCEKGGPHYGSPDKHPAPRLETMRLAGELSVPFTTGILIGIGETRAERIDTLQAIADLHNEFGHIQEVIIQNFRAKPGTRMAAAPEPDMEELLWTIAVARLIFGPEMNIQAPPNLSDPDFGRLVSAGINDWGGVSPVTPDHVNPEAPWPALERLESVTLAAGKRLEQRLAVYPAYVRDLDRWVDPGLKKLVMDAADADGFGRSETWAPGLVMTVPTIRQDALPVASGIAEKVDKAVAGERLEVDEISALFSARGADFDHICNAANDLRRAMNGDTVTYVVNRNINYTNICGFKCQFCAFSKGKMSENLRGKPYDLGTDEVVRRAQEAWDRGATEVCMQGGIHPDYTGRTYLGLCEAVKDALPDMHIHAFSPLEIRHGAETLGISVKDFLKDLRTAGLGTLPGTAAEILDDEVRAILCPDKLNTDEWLGVMADAHALGIRTTATIMYGHVERHEHWARHLLRLRDLQAGTGGFTEFVPLPFVHMEAPIYLKGGARPGPTYREAILMHAVSRLALHPLIPNIQVSWVKMGPDGARHCLEAGVNDLGGTLMNESISRAAGTSHGQEFPPEEMDRLILDSGRTPRIRSTLYDTPDPEHIRRAYDALPLSPVVLTPPKRRAAVAAE